MLVGLGGMIVFYSVMTIAFKYEVSWNYYFVSLIIGRFLFLVLAFIPASTVFLIIHFLSATGILSTPEMLHLNRMWIVNGKIVGLDKCHIYTLIY